MAFISVRKKSSIPAPGEEHVDEVLEDQNNQEQEQDDAEGAGEQATTGVLGWLAAGVSSWWAWSSSRIGARGTYTLHLVATWATFYYGGWTALAIVTVFLLAVGLFLPKDGTDRLLARLDALDKRRTRPAGGPPQDDTENAPVDPLPGLLWQLIGTAPGVHLKTVTEHLAEAARKAHRPAPTQADVEAALGALRIPLRRAVGARDSEGRRRTNRGVHRDDLQPLFPAPPHTPTKTP
ncbi:hypothetical protein [Streptomyces sp. CRN 30]|uniref:hypothetical protein n=1 Tax=Streptomyces sp. CRN 30 TaxID=3075613 RepID=UPI002A81D0A1|nr:hypothetical protein [Streptomyces sp. CRN 30]